MSFASFFSSGFVADQKCMSRRFRKTFLSYGQSTGVSRSLHLYLSCRQMVWIIIWCLRKTDMPTTTWQDITMELKGPGAGHRGGTRYVGYKNIQISMWLSSWEKGRSVSLTLGKVFLWVILECCFQTHLKTNLETVPRRWRNFIMSSRSQRPSKHARARILLCSNPHQPTEQRLTNIWFVSHSL